MLGRSSCAAGRLPPWDDATRLRNPTKYYVVEMAGAGGTKYFCNQLSKVPPPRPTRTLTRSVYHYQTTNTTRPTRHHEPTIRTPPPKTRPYHHTKPSRLPTKTTRRQIRRRRLRTHTTTSHTSRLYQIRHRKFPTNHTKPRRHHKPRLFYRHLFSKQRPSTKSTSLFRQPTKNLFLHLPKHGPRHHNR